MPWNFNSSVRECISSQNTYLGQGASAQKRAWRELKAGPRFSICASLKKWDWKYGPKKRQKRSKTPISRESLPYEKRVLEGIGHAS
jgi:hypothetical protein